MFTKRLLNRQTILLLFAVIRLPSTSFGYVNANDAEGKLRLDCINIVQNFKVGEKPEVNVSQYPEPVEIIRKYRKICFNWISA